MLAVTNYRDCQETQHKWEEKQRVGVNSQVATFFLPSSALYSLVSQPKHKRACLGWDFFTSLPDNKSSGLLQATNRSQPLLCQSHLSSRTLCQLWWWNEWRGWGLAFLLVAKVPGWQAAGRQSRVVFQVSKHALNKKTPPTGWLGELHLACGQVCRLADQPSSDIGKNWSTFSWLELYLAGRLIAIVLLIWSSRASKIVQ